MRIATLALLAALAACGTPPRNNDPAPKPHTHPAPADAAAMEEAAASRSDAVGRPAPSFTVLNQADATERLEDYRGKWVILYFYPKDDTPGCACEATEFTELLWQYNGMGAAVLGMSPDSPADHRKFIKKYGLQLTLLSDPDRSVMSQYGAWVQTTIGGVQKGRVVRSTFLIDPDGKIAWHWPEVLPKGHAARVRDKLEALRAERGEQS